MTEQITLTNATDPKISDNYHLLEKVVANDVYKKMLEQASLYHRQKRVDTISVAESPELKEQIKEFITELDINANNMVSTTNLQDVITVNP
jgi:hypothetical protein